MADAWQRSIGHGQEPGKGCKGFFTWEDPSTRKILEGGTTLHWVYMQKFRSVWCPNIEDSRGK